MLSFLDLQFADGGDYVGESVLFLLFLEDDDPRAIGSLNTVLLPVIVDVAAGEAG